MICLKEHLKDQSAVVCNGEAWTYGELDRRSVRVARNLAGAGLDPGDRIATLLPNCHELTLLYLAAFHGGFTIAPLDARYNSAQINFALRHCGASVLVTHPGQLDDVARCDTLRDVEHRLVIGQEKHSGFSPFYRLLTTRPTTRVSEDFRGDDVAVIFYTSGTTARPKGVTLTRDAITSGISKSNAMLRLQPEDVTLIAASFSRPMALRTQLLPSLAAGATVVLMDRFSPDGYLQTLRESRCTFLALLPSAM
jgi:acyl-CoA synthetase (AMP-forming)/AMP-acid ligase II